MPATDQTGGPPWTILSTLRWTTAYLNEQGVESPRSSAEIMLAHALGCKRIDLYLRYDQPLHQDELARYRHLIKRRAAGEPVAYIVGNKEFWSLDFLVSPAVLIPRPETECLVETALNYFSPGSKLNVLELGCGSGAISVALAHERPAWKIAALDSSIQAILIACRNARRHHLDRGIRFIVGDWFAALSEKTKYDLIITNPPYIKRFDIDTLAPEIRDFEPRSALDGGVDGLYALTQILGSAPRYLAPAGVLMTEIGSDQRQAVSQIVHDYPEYETSCFHKDYAGLDRVAVLINQRNV